MLTYTIYTESGGTGKTTLAANLAVAHARAGLRTLVIPLDPQESNLSRLLNVDDERDDSTVDTLVHHLVEQPQGPFDELLRTSEGVDIVPEHNRLSSLGEAFSDYLEGIDTSESQSVNTKQQLFEVLKGAGVAQEYDVIICDPPATEGPHLYNALYATQTLLIPVEPTQKGKWAIEGLNSLVTGLSKEVQAQVSVVGAVAIRYKDTNDQQDILSELSYSTIEVIRERASLFEGAWRTQSSAFDHLASHTNRVREYEQETVAKIDRIARELESKAGLEAPNPPEPGDLEHTATTTKATTQQ